MEKPIALSLNPPPKSAFFVHALEVVSYSQKSLNETLVDPIPIYPLLPMENPEAKVLAPPPKFAF